ncbi:MAG: protease complex subunit PrcB family protein, partial [Methanophagales archaeon]|nr:protease complex subunit PrcB family protein [Methanophagales archaeon]
MIQKYLLTSGFIAVVIILIILISGCIQMQPQEEQERKQISFETVSKGYYSGHDERKNYVINSQNEWGELWNKTMSRHVPLPEVPAVNFSENTIIAVYKGSHRTGGYSIEITKIVENEQKIVVYIKETSPPSGAGVTMAFTQPYHIVKTE